MRPWRRPWDPDRAGSGLLAPRNGATGRRYRGINLVLLAMAGAASCAGDPHWLTYRQASERGWRVRRGERGTRVFFFRRLAVREGGGEEEGNGDGGGAPRHIPLLRAYTVFHASQVEGIPALHAPAPEASWRTPDAVDAIIRGSGIAVREGGGRAYYAPATDHVQMPPRGTFRSAADHAATLLHEAGHDAAVRIMPRRGA